MESLEKRALLTTITGTSSPVFYIDASATPAQTGMYVSYQIFNNDGVNHDNVWATIGNFTGGVVTKGSHEDGLVNLGSLAAGATKTAFFYLTASGTTSSAQSHTVSVFDGTPSSGPLLTSGSFSFTSVASTIEAAANKVNSAVVGPTPPVLGGIVTLTVTGSTGTIGAAKVLSFTPATASDWPADSYELFTSTITFDAPNSGSIVDTLLVPSSSITSTANTPYTAVYMFRATGVTTGPTPIIPSAYLSSGTQVKHTSTGNYSTLPQLQAVTNQTVLSNLVSTNFLAASGTVTYTLRLSNTGSNDAIFDRFVDTLSSSPANATYVVGSSTFNGSALADPTVSGQTLTWSGSFTVPAESSRDLVFQVVVPNTSGTYTNSAVAFAGTTQIDTTLTTTDSAPATVTVAVNTPPNANSDSATTNEDTSVAVNVVANDTDVDGNLDPTTVTILTGPANGTVSVNHITGAVTYTPNANFNGVNSITYRIADTSGATATGTITITVNAVNDAPAATGNSFSVDEDNTLTVAAAGVLGNDTDVDGNSLSAVLVTGPTHGSLTFNANGSFSYTPGANFNGSDSFTYKANDGTLDSNVATVSILINAVNDAPQAAGNNYSVTEGNTLNVAAAGVLGNDSDVDGNTLTAVLISFPEHGSLTLNADGSFSYTPDEEFTGSDSFLYQAYDGVTYSSIVTVIITVKSATAENNAPVATSDSFSVAEDATLTVAAAGVLGNDSDVDGDQLFAVLVAGPEHGSLSLNENGSFSYTPAANFNGSDSFTYKANDGLLDSETVTVSLTVTAVNDAPAATGDSYSVNEDATLTVAAAGVLGNDGDVDGNELSAVLVTGPAHGSLSLNENGSFSYAPAANFNGSDSFTYKANDGLLDSEVVTVSITVNAVNDAPAATGESYSVNEDATLTVAAAGVLGNDGDVDGDQLFAVLVAGPEHGSLSLNENGSFSYTPAANFNGSDSFTYKANDGLLDSETVTVSLTVTAVNDAPAATGDSYSVNEDATLTVAAAGVLGNDGDVDGNELIAVLVAGPAHGSLSLNENGSFSYAPAANFNGSDSFTYKANDGLLDSGVVTVSITVNAVNDAPILVTPIGNRTTTAGTAFVLDVAAYFSDVDGEDVLNFTATRADGSPLPSWLSFSGTSLSGTSIEADFGSISIKVTVTDGFELAVSETFTLTVNEFTSPTVTLTAPSLTNDTTPSITIAASDLGSGVVESTADLDIDLNNDGDFNDTIGGRSERSYASGTLSEGSVTFDVSPALSSGTYAFRARVRDAAGNEGQSSLKTVVIDALAPTATLTPNTNGPTNATSVTYVVDFSETVSNISVDDFSLTTGGMTASIASVSATSGNRVTVLVNTISGNGTLRLNLKSGTNIVDAAGNQASASSGGTVVIDQSAPTADIMDVTPDPRITSVGSVSLNFSEVVTGVDAADFTLTRNGVPVALTDSMLSGGGRAYQLNLASVTASEGVYVLTLNGNGTGIVDSAGNSLTTAATDEWFTASTSVVASGGVVTITEVLNTTNDNIVLSIHGDYLRVVYEGIYTEIPRAGLSQVIIDLGAGDDMLTLDFSGGPLPFNITLNGGDGGYDTLKVTNLNSVFTAYTVNDFNAHDGTIQFRNGGQVTTQLNFTGLEPLVIDGTPTEIVFNLTPGDDSDATLRDIGGADGFLRLSGSTFESLDFSIAAATSITINGLSGNDHITVQSIDSSFTGSLTINGDAGNDTLDASTVRRPVTLQGGDGDDSLTGSGRNDSLDGGSGDDVLLGGGGNDTLHGGLGNDILTGGLGIDRVIESGSGRLTLTNTGLTGAGTDELSSIEEAELSGGDRDDLLDASAFNLGSVTLKGLGANDTLLGSSRADLLDGGTGTDTVWLNLPGETTSLLVLINGDTTSATMSTNRVIDRLLMVESVSVLSGSGRDTLDGSQFTGRDTLMGNDGEDLILGSQAGGLLNGMNGKDSIIGSDGNETILGGSGNDTLFGNGGNDFIKGQAHSDSIDGGAGDDTLYGEGDNNTPFGNDIIRGGIGNDFISGNAGNDTLLGEADNDTLVGEDGLDDLSGGDGDDLMNGGGETGNPFANTTTDGNDRMLGGIGNDTLLGSAGNDLLDGGDGHDRLDGQGNNDTVLGGRGNDSLSGSAGNDIVLGGDGNDTLDGGSGTDTLAGQADNDVILNATASEINEFFTFNNRFLLI